MTTEPLASGNPASRRRPGRPSVGPRTSTGVRLPDDLHERLIAAATERDVSANFLVGKAVAQFLDRLIPVDEMKWTRDV